ncbi:ABC-F family ATP-binding cassette domain-containing protein [Neomicrococcus lactis]|uniref:ABC-F family ATP-binding cassette domain-containing protein n=1 Tax=Neomicrococcus lactis TaxID=732241 RepID=UPI002301D440|nr:ABC-F family ATP-binding cassette domain-containing protein [Neomicrococcus lactis]
MAHLLGAENLSIAFNGRVILDGASLGLNEGDRIGMVGRNGDGKSTLMRLLAKRGEADSGRVTWVGGLTVGYLDQQDVLDCDMTVGEAIVGDADEHEWASNRTARDVMDGLVKEVDWHAKVEDLSGGQKRRVALAKLLLGEHDVLMLDEPTNHLDVEGVHWLANHLKNRWRANQGGLLVVTHDRWFLDEVSTKTWEVHDGIVEPFEGGYAAYILQRVERDRQAASIESKRQNLAKKELAWLRRGAPARTSKPKFRIDAANALIADVPEIRDKVELASLAVTRLGRDVVDILDASVSYPGKDVLKKIEWRLAPGERTGILGVNGAGKSTLLGLIDGTVEPTAGRVKRGKTVKVATLSQKLDELADFINSPVREVISRLRTSYTIGSGSKAQDLTPGQLLERLGFSTNHLSTPIKDLSGGQKRRLQLLMILLEQPNILILDEPTNDLDTDMLAAMEDLLDTWPGTLIVVSHDRYFLERVTDQQYALFGGKLRHLPGGVDEYLRLRMEEESLTGAAPSSSKSSTTTQPASEDTPAVSGAERRAAQKEITTIDRRLQKLSQSIEKVHAKMAAHDQSDFDGLRALNEELREFEDEVATLEERWLELSEIVG